VHTLAHNPEELVLFKPSHCSVASCDNMGAQMSFCDLNTMHGLSYPLEDEKGSRSSFQKLLEGDLFGGSSYQPLNLPQSNRKQQ